MMSAVIGVQWLTQKASEGGPKFRYSRVTSQTSFAFAKTAWFCFTFLGSEGVGAWHSGLLLGTLVLVSTFLNHTATHSPSNLFFFVMSDSRSCPKNAIFFI